MTAARNEGALTGFPASAGADVAETAVAQPVDMLRHATEMVYAAQRQKAAARLSRSVRQALELDESQEIQAVTLFDAKRPENGWWVPVNDLLRVAIGRPESPRAQIRFVAIGGEESSGFPRVSTEDAAVLDMPAELPEEYEVRLHPKSSE